MPRTIKSLWWWVDSVLMHIYVICFGPTLGFGFCQSWSKITETHSKNRKFWRYTRRWCFFNPYTYIGGGSVWHSVSWMSNCLVCDALSMKAKWFALFCTACTCATSFPSSSDPCISSAWSSTMFSSELQHHSVISITIDQVISPIFLNLFSSLTWLCKDDAALNLQMINHALLEDNLLVFSTLMVPPKHLVNMSCLQCV